MALSIMDQQQRRRVKERARALRASYQAVTGPYAEYLDSVRRSHRRVEQLAARCDHLRELAQRVSVGKDGVHTAAHGGGNGGIESCVTSLLDESDRLQNEAKRLLERSRRAEKLIRGLPDAEKRGVLEARYLNNMTWEQVADYTGYTPRYVQQMHREALLTLASLHQLGILRVPSDFGKTVNL